MSKLHGIMSAIALVLALITYTAFVLTGGGITIGILSLWMLIVHVKHDILHEIERGK